jgi:lysine biosynthesis protein LysW
MTSAFCPDCGQKIVLGPKPRKGQLISCPHCNADLEIIAVNPLELDWAVVSDDDLDDDPDDLEREEELWDDEDWEDDDWEVESDDEFDAGDEDWPGEDREEL